MSISRPVIAALGIAFAWNVTSRKKQPKKIVVHCAKEALRRASFHEAAHATVALRLYPQAVQDAVITTSIEVDDVGGEQHFSNRVGLRTSSSDLDRRRHRAMIAIFYAGLSGEEIVFGDYCINCEDDVTQATKWALRDVNVFGTERKATPISFTTITQSLGHDKHMTHHVMDWVNTVCRTERERARTILTEEDALFRAIAAALLERHYLTREELLALRDQHMVAVH